jgi:hypothetical protein
MASMNLTTTVPSPNKTALSTAGATPGVRRKISPAAQYRRALRKGLGYGDTRTLTDAQKKALKAKGLLGGPATNVAGQSPRAAATRAVQSRRTTMRTS